jgi:hypothetical protein
MNSDRYNKYYITKIQLTSQRKNYVTYCKLLE